jgi:hypothetical protein
MNYSEKDLAALISEVEDEFTKSLTKAEEQTEEETIAKSEETEEETLEAAEVEVEETIEKSEEEVLDYDEEDFEEMDGLYAGMTKAEAEAHYKSVKKALFGESEESGEVISKSEEEVSEIPTEEKEEVIAKSEYDAVIESKEQIEKERDELKKSFEELTDAIKSFNKSRAPKQKAITKMAYLGKNEESSEGKEEVDVSALSKSDIAKKLTEKIRSGEVKKSEDKEAIQAFYLENKSIETIKHLL